MNTEELIQYVYSNKQLLFELVKGLVGRETAFLSKSGGASFRNIKAHKVDFLLKNFEALRFFDKEMNIYHSVAYLENMPMFSFAPPLRKKQGMEFNKNFDSYVRGYDFVVDIDYKGDFKKTYDEAKEVIILFEELKLPYYIKFSGNGFHIVIPHKFIPLSNNSGILDTFSDTGTRMKELLDSSLMDADVYDSNGELLRTGIYDKRRVIKASYSLDVTTGRLCIPITLSEFNNFNYGLVNPEKFLSNNIMNRGLLINNENSGKNFVDLINYFKDGE